LDAEPRRRDAEDIRGVLSAGSARKSPFQQPERSPAIKWLLPAAAIATAARCVSLEATDWPDVRQSNAQKA